MIGIVVDSSSQLTPELATRHGITVVPMVVEVNGVVHAEGVDLDADQFYAAWADGVAPTVATSQPSPGAFVAAYERAIEAGATELLSIHVTETMSGTVNSARLAARSVDVPVRVVDSGTASFGVACCALSAADAIAASADLDVAARVASTQAPSLRTSFVVGVPELTQRSGRADGLVLADGGSEEISVLAMAGSDLEVLDTVASVPAAVEVMAADAIAWADRSPSAPIDGLRVGVGWSDEPSRVAADALASRLLDHQLVADLLYYRIGPSVGAHTGPGTVGLFCS